MKKKNAEQTLSNGDGKKAGKLAQLTQFQIVRKDSVCREMKKNIRKQEWQQIENEQLETQLKEMRKHEKKRNEELQEEEKKFKRHWKKLLSCRTLMEFEENGGSSRANIMANRARKIQTDTEEEETLIYVEINWGKKKWRERSPGGVGKTNMGRKYRCFGTQRNKNDLSDSKKMELSWRKRIRFCGKREKKMVRMILTRVE